VLLNLLVNAGHAIAECGVGGRGVIRVSTRDDGSDVVITIADTGGGIPEAIRPRIFEPFFTTKPVGQGTGQGLSLVYAMIVERHEGQIAFDSVVGEGTTFTIRIPAAGRACAPRQRRVSEAHP
jgi:two-component system, NtrC family, sensor kinase